MNELQVIERLAKLETRVSALEGDIVQVGERIDNVSTKVDQVLARLDKQQSFVGGVVFVLSALWGLLYAFKDWIIGK
jgi:DNA anti-recombination protein RmuC